jgi:hypothetical protein
LQTDDYLSFSELSPTIVKLEIPSVSITPCKTGKSEQVDVVKGHDFSRGTCAQIHEEFFSHFKERGTETQ